MGRKLYISASRESTQFTFKEGEDYPTSFEEEREWKSLYFRVIESGDGKTLGYEIIDIEYIEEEEIPDIEDVYDLEELGLMDATIKEIVMTVKKNKNENPAFAAQWGEVIPYHRSGRRRKRGRGK